MEGRKPLRTAGAAEAASASHIGPTPGTQPLRHQARVSRPCRCDVLPARTQPVRIQAVRRSVTSVSTCRRPTACRAPCQARGRRAEHLRKAPPDRAPHECGRRQAEQPGRGAQGREPLAPLPGSPAPAASPSRGTSPASFRWFDARRWIQAPASRAKRQSQAPPSPRLLRQPPPGRVADPAPADPEAGAKLLPPRRAAGAGIGLGREAALRTAAGPTHPNPPQDGPARASHAVCCEPRSPAPSACARTADTRGGPGCRRRPSGRRRRAPAGWRPALPPATPPRTRGATRAALPPSGHMTPAGPIAAPLLSLLLGR